MPGVPALDRFRKLVDDISRLCVNARRAQVQFALETGRRIVGNSRTGPRARGTVRGFCCSSQKP